MRSADDKIILCKVTSRERPQQLYNCVAAYIKYAHKTDRLRFLFTLDTDDETNNPELMEKLLDLIEPLGHGHLCVAFTGDSLSKIHAINRDIDKYEHDWDILLNISDDQMPVTMCWDSAIANAMPDHLDASLWFDDGAGHGRINTQEILGRVYYQNQGYVYNPEYKSFFCDNESTEVALRLGKCIKRPDCIIKHFHPQWDRSGLIKEDNLYRKNNKFWNEDQATYKRRKARNFN